MPPTAARVSPYPLIKLNIVTPFSAGLGYNISYPGILHVTELARIYETSFINIRILIQCRESGRL
jgi:hypothetical protein